MLKSGCNGQYMQYCVCVVFIFLSFLAVVLCEDFDFQVNYIIHVILAGRLLTMVSNLGTLER